MKIFVIQHYQRNTKLFLNGTGILNVLYISGKMKKKEEKSESFCLRENVYCVVDLFI